MNGQNVIGHRREGYDSDSPIATPGDLEELENRLTRIHKEFLGENITVEVDSFSKYSHPKR